MTARDEYARAKARGERRRLSEPYAIAARYDGRRRRIVVDLSTGVSVAFPPAVAEGLQDAQPRDLRDIEITPSGFGLHFPRLDADLYLPGLLADLLGSARGSARPATLKDLLLSEEVRVDFELPRRGRHARRSPPRLD
jgi:hypothetical protein